MYGHVITKFSRMGSLPHFLTHGDTLRAVRARELRYNLRDGPLENLFGRGGGGKSIKNILARENKMMKKNFTLKNVHVTA